MYLFQGLPWLFPRRGTKMGQKWKKEKNKGAIAEVQECSYGSLA